MKKQSYIAPEAICYRTKGEGCLLAGSYKGAWTPADKNDQNPQPPIDIKDEKDGNLGDEGSEITGAKHNTSWGFWGN